jgi:hypothetical protein
MLKFAPDAPNNLTVKTEYLYVDLGTNTLLNRNLFGVVAVNIHQKTTANIVRAGLNYKFDWFYYIILPAPLSSPDNTPDLRIRAPPRKGARAIDPY